MKRTSASRGRSESGSNSPGKSGSNGSSKSGGNSRSASGWIGRMPLWLSQLLGGLGLSTLLYGLIRYTFIGEFFERLYKKTLGHSPIEDLPGHGETPKEQRAHAEAPQSHHTQTSD